VCLCTSISSIVAITLVSSSSSLLPQPNQHTLIIPRLKIQIQARVHQRLAAISAIESIARVPRVALQTLHLERRRRGFDASLLLESEHEGLVFFCADELHGRPVGVVGEAQAVEGAGDDDGVDFFPVGENAWDRSGFFGGEVGGFEFEAEGAALIRGLALGTKLYRSVGGCAYHESDVGAVLDGDVAVGQVVGDN
jgi:hypothetical protein